MATNTLILSLKISLLSITILSLAILTTLYIPELISELPLVWGSLRSWLTPPYLYVIINFIIITIAASSRYQHKLEEEVAEPVKAPLPAEFQQSFAAPRVYDYEEIAEPVKAPLPAEFLGASRVYEEEVVVVEDNGLDRKLAVGEEEAKIIEEDAVEVGGGTGNILEVELEEPLIRVESVEAPAVENAVSKEKPPVSARFGRKIPKGGSEGGKSLKVSKPKRQDTLESTWKMITEGRPMPLARHLKKSDTWETHTTVPKAEQVKHSETMNSRDNGGEAPTSTSTLARSQGSGSMKLRKEPSLSQDELNRRVEAFINKFNEEMRLQRLESLNRYKEMVV